MRASLRASLANDPTFEGYPKGSIVICGDCWKPVYVLERGISLGDRGGRAASAFRPLTWADCQTLFTRPDLDPAWRGLFAAFCASPAAQAMLHAPRPRAGQDATCPLCGGSYLKGRTVELADTLDRAYVLEMATIPPMPSRVKNPWLGTQTRWTREDDPSVTVELVRTIRES